MKNSKSTGSKVTSLAAKTLASPGASAIQKKLAGSALSQSGTTKTTGAGMEGRASAALKNANASATTKILAGSIVSQSKK